MAFSPNGRILASSSYYQTVKLSDPRTVALNSTLQGHSGPVTRIAFSRKGELRASGSGRSDLSIRLWNEHVLERSKGHNSKPVIKPGRSPAVRVHIHYTTGGFA